MVESKTVEERLAHLENEFRILYDRVFPGIDEEIYKVSARNHEIGDQAHQTYQNSVEKISELERSIRETLQDVVNKLVAKSSSKIVTDALRSMIIAVRRATRAEVQSGEAIATRQVSAAEIRGGGQ